MTERIEPGKAIYTICSGFEVSPTPSVASFRQILNFEIGAGPMQASRLRRLGRGRHYRPSRASRMFTRSGVHNADDSTLWTVRHPRAAKESESPSRWAASTPSQGNVHICGATGNCAAWSSTLTLLQRGRRESEQSARILLNTNTFAKAALRGFRVLGSSRF